MVVGSLASFFFSVSFGVFMCLFVYLFSHFCTVTLGSQLISLSSNVDFLFARIKFVISYIKYDSVPVLRSFGEKMEKDERVRMYYLLIKWWVTCTISISCFHKPEGLKSLSAAVYFCYMYCTSKKEILQIE